MKVVKHFSVSALILFVLIGCNKPVDEARLPGEYKWNRSDKIEILILNRDGTYYHKFWSRRHQLDETSGKREFLSDEQEILFKDFVVYNEGGRKYDDKGNWFSAVSIASNHHVRLNYSRDENLFFEKKTIEKTE